MGTTILTLLGFPGSENALQAVRPQLHASSLEGLVRVWRGCRNSDWVELDLLLQMLEGGLELGVFSPERRVRQVVHDDVRVNPVTFDQPFAFRSINAMFCCRRDSFIHQPIVERKPDFAAPGASADDLAQTQPFEALGKCLPIGAGVFVARRRYAARQ